MKNTSYDPMKDPAADAGLIRPLKLDNAMFGTDKRLEKVYEYRNVLHMHLECTAATGTCPCCGHESSTVHQRKEVSIHYPSIEGKTAVAHIKKRQFTCKNKDCGQKTFDQKVEGVTKRRRNSDSVFRQALGRGISASAVGAAIGMKSCGTDISHDTITRLVKAMEVPDDPDVEVIGADDVSSRKACYNTSVYNGVTHIIMALFPGRDGSALRLFLEKHPKVGKVNRDRGTAYHSAISSLDRGIREVADRFHLSKNLIDHAKEIMKEAIPKNIAVENGIVTGKEAKKVYVNNICRDEKSLDTLTYDNTPVFEDGAEVRVVHTQKVSGKAAKEQEDRRMEKKNNYLEIRQKNRQGSSPKALAAEYGYCISTIRGCLKMTDEEVGKMHEIKRHVKQRPNLVDGYDNIIYKMLRDGRPVDVIAGYVLRRGYPGAESTLMNSISAISENHFSRTLSLNEKRKPGYPNGTEVIGRGDVLCYLVASDKASKKDTLVAKYIGQIIEKLPVAAFFNEAWNRFHKMMEIKDASDLRPFIEAYKGTKLDSFAKGLEMDFDAVKAGLEDPSSSGYVEGGNNKYKEIKRRFYGRASNLLILNVMYASSTLQNGTETIDSLLRLKSVSRKA